MIIQNSKLKIFNDIVCPPYITFIIVFNIIIIIKEITLIIID